MGSKTFVYLAGPYRAPDGGHDYRAFFEIDRNINEARLWATRLANEGVPFFCPHMNGAHMEVLAPDVTQEYWLDLDMRILECSSALLLLPNWRESKGAVAEKERAQKLGILCYDFVVFHNLVDWWHEGKKEASYKGEPLHVKPEGVYAQSNFFNGG